MKCTIINLTPELAGEILKKNKGNRNVSSATVDFYQEQMKRGLWKENGEPIIIGSDGVVKDGQHRMIALIKANHEYKVPMITDVDPESMDTIDTGKNRSLSDILSLNGFKYSIVKSKLAKLIMLYDSNKLMKTGAIKDNMFRSSSRKNRVSNSAGLQYVQENDDFLNELIKTCVNINNKSARKVFTDSDLCFLGYMLSGKEFNPLVREFLKQISGAVYSEYSSAS